MLEVNGSQALASFLPLSSVGSTSTTLVTYSESVPHTSKSASNSKHIENKRKNEILECCLAGLRINRKLESKIYSGPKFFIWVCGGLNENLPHRL